MGRLLDEDVLLEDMKTFKDNCESIGITPNWEHANRIIKEQPTAYDVEAKVAELKKVAFERFGNDGMGGQKVVSLDDAISIVRGKE